MEAIRPKHPLRLDDGTALISGILTCSGLSRTKPQGWACILPSTLRYLNAIPSSLGPLHAAVSNRIQMRLGLTQGHLSVPRYCRQSDGYIEHHNSIGDDGKFLVGQVVEETNAMCKYLSTSVPIVSVQPPRATTHQKALGRGMGKTDGDPTTGRTLFVHIGYYCSAWFGLPQSSMTMHALLACPAEAGASLPGTSSHSADQATRPADMLSNHDGCPLTGHLALQWPPLHLALPLTCMLVNKAMVSCHARNYFAHPPVHILRNIRSFINLRLPLP
ncbi:uncharacterized protein LY79DRAFT_6562 [Colletotrichum navitas]|uniref:Uncharacterized protein n=1 Tax=Colletotrichum navitas TaxID=681940 RepID=A0AAD8VCJ2_9PEZI|nr:uncharacterized protein LY79DRAFT_6562 [Colletotrichum navitas]KAK1600111.1 hypothetical protein LY79DRAFT_6562 [Colletotrichum navitas]